MQRTNDVVAIWSLPRKRKPEHVLFTAANAGELLNHLLQHSDFKHLKRKDLILTVRIQRVDVTIGDDNVTFWKMDDSEFAWVNVTTRETLNETEVSVGKAF